MSHVDFAGIAEPHQSTVTAIRQAAGRGLLTAAETLLLIDRLRKYVTKSPLFIENFPPETAGTLGAHPISPDKTV